MGYKTITEHIRDHLLNINRVTIDELRETEWSPKFEMLMRNRLIQGAFRYYPFKTYGQPQYDMIGSIKKRLEIYIKTGNTESLVDIANLCLKEFAEGKHPNKHFKSIDDGEHTSIIENTEKY